MHTNTHKKFLNPTTVLFNAGLKAGQTVVDLGAGSGFFALASAEIVGNNGHVDVVDVKDTALEHIVAEAKMRNLKNIKTYIANLDLAKLPSHIRLEHADVVILANILHEIQDMNNLLIHTYAMLKSGGRVVVIDWNDTPGHFGPVADKRVGEEKVKKVIGSKFQYIKNIETDQYHYGLVFEK